MARPARSGSREASSSAMISATEAARDGKRFRSLGECDITFPVPSNAASIAEIVAELEASREPERAGRAMDYESEDAFERLRTEGYM